MELDAGTKVYSAYTSTLTPGLWWINEGELTDIVSSGVPLVRMHSLLLPLDSKWHVSKSQAKADAAFALARQIGELQAKLDTLRDEILHEALCREEEAAA